MRSRATTPEVSLFHVYSLRLSYLLLAVGLGRYIWPAVIHHSNEFAATEGVRFGLLAGLGAMALLGLRYPVQMLPLLLFEVTWKAIYLIAFALPLESAQRVNPTVEADINACLMVFVFIPLIPWRYVFARYALQRGERWN